ncbi:GNAT family N-acetyltransferase [Afifella sp. IM 167]|uniref:GNAT family N-acetyltransferase n=1 Tax=Afifella sp. IM 167 TaxID=2033586 RepID=UPI001CCDD203|nr:GNAT family N-acetyltransferase [Afifella sp. IM 167]MBZ8132649.1 GNAT family N-acetyltransferase [Afifella sp. IM 167]
MAPDVRPLAEADRAAFAPLWQAYLDFYGTRLEPEVTDTTWRRIVDPTGPLCAFGAFLEGRLAGFAIYFFHPGTWTTAERCYLEDLFVAAEARGSGVGRALMEAVFSAAGAAGASEVYWQTETDNAVARALYDRLGELTEYVKYRHTL